MCVFFCFFALCVCARNARLIQLAAQYQTKPDNNLQAQYKRSFGICMQAWNGYKSLVKISRQWIICHANQFRRRNKKLSKKNWINEKTKKMGFPLLLSPFNLRLTLDIYEKKTHTHQKRNKSLTNDIESEMQCIEHCVGRLTSYRRKNN